MSKKTQLLKGILEGCILSIISRKETYGYAVCEVLYNNGFEELNEGTVYPILTRLEKSKLLSSVKKASPLGPKRKYYFLTEQGYKYLYDFNSEWKNIKLKVDNILQEGFHEKQN